MLNIRRQAKFGDDPFENTVFKDAQTVEESTNHTIRQVFMCRTKQQANNRPVNSKKKKKRQTHRDALSDLVPFVQF